jgi:hypothetical protein
MKTIRYTMALLAISVTAFLSCSKRDLTAPKSSSISARSGSNSVVCGTPKSFNLIDKYKVQLGTVSVSNDATNVYITINISDPDFKLVKTALIIGTQQHVTDGVTTGWPKLGPGPLNPDYSQTFKPGVTTYTFTVPLSGLEDCFDFAIYGKLTKKVDGKNVADIIFLQSDPQLTTKCWQTYAEYCKQDCPPPPDCGQLTTFTQGGYGNDQGNGAGTSYMIAHFATAFPSGVTIGCASGFTQKMTTAASIQAYLPSGSTAVALTQNYVDNGPNTVLGGQLLTLALSVGFDNADPNFGAAGVLLEDMVIGSGTFAGKTVGEFLAIANDVYGGCSNAYTPQQVEDEADLINNNYDGGTVDKGHLTCPNAE